MPRMLIPGQRLGPGERTVHSHARWVSRQQYRDDMRPGSLSGYYGPRAHAYAYDRSVRERYLAKKRRQHERRLARKQATGDGR